MNTNNNSKVLIGVIVAVLVIVGAIFIFALSRGSNVTTTNPTTQPIQPESTVNNVQQQVVTVTTTGFTPATLSIKAGSRVVWQNKSGQVVTVNSANHPTHQVYRPLNLGEFNDGSSVQLVFDKAGTYTYHNHLNDSQTGQIVVQ